MSGTFGSDDEQPVTGITVIRESDVVCGRGGAGLKHPGNVAYRKIVNINKALYATCLKVEKLRISRSIVAAIRDMNGYFLEREDGKISVTLDEKNPDGTPVTWRDIGDRRAIEKTSQALREGQPKLLKQLKQFDGDGQLGPLGVKFMETNTLDQPSTPQTDAPAERRVRTHYEQLPGIHSSFSTVGSASSSNTLRAGTTSKFLQKDNYNLLIGDTLNNNRSSQGDYSAVSNESYDSWANSYRNMPQQILDQPNGSIRDSWLSDPSPLPYNTNSAIALGTDESNHLLDCLGVKSTRTSGSSTVGSGSQGDDLKVMKKHTTLSHGFNLRSSTLSMVSHFSELSLLDAQSLDSAMDVAERESELQLLGDEYFDWENTSYEKVLANMSQTMNDVFGGDGLESSLRGSILRHNSRLLHNPFNSFPPAALADKPDLGMLFTSTFDAKPGGINAGTDVSSLIGERRKSTVTFELRGRTSRISNISALSGLSGMYRRDVGSVASIQTADIREILGMYDDDD